MRKIRKLYLQNAAGERYGLNGERGIYASSLAGFGFTMSPVFADLGRGFYIPVSDQSEPQNTVPFTVHFTKQPYEEYQRFVNWLSSAGTVTVVYDPTGKQEYCRDVTVNFLQKGELNDVGWLEVPCSYYCSTPWYLQAPATLILESGGAGSTKRYDYTYDEDLVYGINSAASMAGEIAPSGHIPAALQFVYHGEIVNPRIRLVGTVTGHTYGICSLAAATIPSDQLIICTRYESAYVQKVSAAGEITDLLDALDLSTTPFFRVPVDEPCEISVEADNAISGHAELTIFYYFRSV